VDYGKLGEVIEQSNRFWSQPQFDAISEPGLIEHVAEEAQEFADTPNSEEAADMVITLFMWAQVAGIDLVQAVKDKVDINELRDWVVLDSGSYHRAGKYD
jgi:NTP pyrophosphatase (non-canonical NTP hydrolase)